MCPFSACHVAGIAVGGILYSRGEDAAKEHGEQAEFELPELEELAPGPLIKLT